jgi:hypothetical protein
MRQQKHIGFEVVRQTPRQEAELELVIPFTTPRLTRAALDAANRMGTGLHTAVRVLQIQVVPYPLRIEESPVVMDFLKARLARLQSVLPIRSEILLTRDFDPALESALNQHSIVILASPSRPWRTRNERLADRLRRAGHSVVMVKEGIDA